MISNEFFKDATNQIYVRLVSTLANYSICRIVITVFTFLIIMFFSKKNNLSNNKKQVIYLYFSTYLGVFLGVISSIVNTRFVDPVDYGDVRYIQNILNFIASFLLFGYFLTGSRQLALSKDEDYCRRIRGAMVVILLVTSIFLVICSIICYYIHHNRTNVSYLFIVSLPVCFYPLFLNYINTTAQGDNHIVRLSCARLIPPLLYVPMAFIIYSIYGATPTKMILLQWGLSTIVLGGIIISTKPSFHNLKPVFKILSKENRDYGIHLYTGSLIMVTTNYLAGISLGHYNADNTLVGFYTLALTIATPLSYVPSIIGTTYFKQFATEPKIPDRIMSITLVVTVVSAVLFIFIINPLVSFLYSEKYQVVGLYASLLALGFSIHGFGDMINRYLGSHGEGKSIRNSSIANGLFKLFGYIFFVKFYNIWGAIATTLICDVIYSVMLVFYYNKNVKKQITG